MKPDRGLDWLNLLLACIGSSYGAFIPVYLTTQAWTQTQIGVVLTAGTVASMVSQVPTGLFIDLIGRRRRAVLYAAVAVTGVVPLVFAITPRGPPILLAMVVQAAMGAVLSPAIAAISCAVAGQDGMGERFGRNSRYGSIGAGLGAAIMGACGYLGSQRLAFVVAALLTIPARLSIRRIGPDHAEPTVADQRQPGLLAPLALLKDRRLLVYAACVALFQVASIAIIQLAAVGVTTRLGSHGALVIAAFLIVPQIVVAVLSPWIGKTAGQIGHRPVLLAGFATVPLRGLLFAMLHNPYLLIPAQILEGLGGATYGVMMPLVASGLTSGKGHYTLCLSLLGLAGGAGTAVSTALAGWTADHYGRTTAYWLLTVAGLAALLLVVMAMPETNPRKRAAAEAKSDAPPDRTPPGGAA
jgi:MFS family permease